ncbi:MAG: HAD-IA family hydrolase [Eubacterium sp.]|nr:HAD-IA family hydrolase [Eubacterium sp.]
MDKDLNTNINNNIKNIVFDVGDVLVDFRYKDYMRDLGFDEELVEFLSVNIVQSEFWHEMDMGIKCDADAIQKFTSDFPQYKNEIISFWANIKDIVAEYDYSVPLIKNIKSNGYKVYILSNYPEELSEKHWPDFKFLPLADGYIISAYEKLCKPDPAIYKLLETRFNIKLSQSLFIDDRMPNIEGAENVGMHALLFESYDKTINKLKELGIL